MIKKSIQATDGLIYPGVYVPMLSEEELRKALKSYDKGEMLFPLVNVSELSDSFEMEIAVPGVKREDFLITTDANALSIRVFHKDYSVPENKNIQLQEFNYGYFDRHIILPANSDSEFIIAKYCDGILRLHVPKAKHPVKIQQTNIIVY